VRPRETLGPIENRIAQMVDFTTEDLSLCLRAQQRGAARADMRIAVEHEKQGVMGIFTEEDAHG